MYQIVFYGLAIWKITEIAGVIHFAYNICKGAVDAGSYLIGKTKNIEENQLFICIPMNPEQSSIREGIIISPD